MASTLLWLGLTTVISLSSAQVQNQQLAQCPYNFDLVVMFGTAGNICQGQPDLQSAPVPAGFTGPCFTCQNWRNILEFGLNVTNLFVIGPNVTQVAVVLFGNTVNLGFYLNRYTNKNDVANAINNNLCYPDPNVNTEANLYDALNFTMSSVLTRANGFRPKTQALLSIVSTSTSSNNPVLFAKLIIKTMPVTISTLGITPSANTNQLQQVATAPGFNFYSNDYSNLLTQLPNMVPQECKPIPFATNYNNTACRNTLDVCLLIDVSGSICDTDPATRRTYVAADDGGTYATCGNWQLVQTFLRQVAASFIIGPNDVQIGAIAFGNNARMLWYLNTYQTNTQVDLAINLIKYSALGENTATADALALAYSTCFSPEFGKRPNVPDVTIVVTDGKPTVNVDQTEGNALALQNDQRYGQASEVITVGISSSVDTDILCKIATFVPPPGNVNITCFYQASFSGLESILLSLQSLVCNTFPTVATIAPTTQAPIPTRNCSNAVDVVFVIDESGSIGQQNFVMLKSFLSNLIMELSIDNGISRVGLVFYSDNVVPVFNLNSYSRRVDAANAVMNISYIGGTTNTAAALAYVTDTMFTEANGDRSNVMNLAIVITDGESNDKQATIAQAVRAKTTKDIQIVSVGVGNWINVYELNAIASYPFQTHYLNISNYQNLTSHFNEFFALICNEVNECARTVCQNGGACRDLITTFWCDCPPNIGGRYCEMTCRLPGDVAFLIDSSASITQQNFAYVTSFVTDIVINLPVDGTHHIALETFSNSASVVFHFQYSSKRQTVDALSRLYYTNKNTNTADALTLMRTDVFSSANGYSGGLATGVVITDGYSDVPASTWAQAIQARQNGIRLIAIGVTKSVRVQELVNIASFPASIVNGQPTPNAFNIDSFGNLTALENVVVSTICSNNDKCQPSPCLNGGSCSSQMNAYTCQCGDFTRFSGVNCQLGCTGVIDVAFAIDTSGSTRLEIYPQVIELFVTILGQLAVQASPVVAQVAAVTGGASSTTVNFNLNTYTSGQDVAQALRQIKYVGGSSNIPLLLSTARTQVFGTAADRPSAPNYLVLFTNVGGVLNTQLAAQEAANVKNAGIQLIIVSIGSDVNTQAFAQMASYPPLFSQFAVKFMANASLIPPFVTTAMCDSFDNCSTAVCQNGGTCRHVLNDYYCDCPADVVGRVCDRTGCTRTEDVLIINDMSYSQANIQQMQQQIIRYLVNRINYARVNLALITYSNNATVQFRLGQYSTRRQYLNALTYPLTTGTGRTNTQDALTQANTIIFQTSNGARANVFQRVILLTNGGSNIVQQNTIPSAQVLKNRSITIDVITVAPEENIGEVDSIASVPSFNYTFKFPTGEVDYTKIDTLVQSMCS